MPPSNNRAEGTLGETKQSKCVPDSISIAGRMMMRENAALEYLQTKSKKIRQAIANGARQRIRDQPSAKACKKQLAFEREEEPLSKHAAECQRQETHEQQR
jgi:hypothetical protein